MDRLLLLKSLANKDNGGVKSWNDLKDRPFGDEVEYIALTHEQPLSNRQRVNSNISGFYFTSGAFKNGLNGEYIVDGETYSVTVDGTEYIGTAQRDENGRVNIFGYYTDRVYDGAPIRVTAIASQAGKSVSVGFPDDEKHMVKIAHVKTNITTLDPKYLPDSVPTETRVQELISERLGVIENGTY